MFGCAAQTELTQGARQPEVSRNAIDIALDSAITAFRATDYNRTVETLKASVADGYTYHRADEILYWIGYSRMRMNQSSQALNAFSALRDYYPWIESKYSNINELEELAGNGAEKRYFRDYRGRCI